MSETDTFEWPTLALLCVTYVVWAAATTVVAGWWLPAGIALTAVAVAQYSSLQHEMIHGHPFKHDLLNALLVFPALLPVAPYLRFKDLHLAHHRDSDLTDPFDDPESNYLAPEVWTKLSPSLQMILNFNNTLAGRILIGPAIGTFAFLRSELDALRSNKPARRGWLLHIPAVLPLVIWLVATDAMPLWTYALAVYGAMSLLRIRTFLEHQAHEKVRGRTVIIDDSGPLALLFLMNNFHVIHHTHPRLPWYRLRRVFHANRTHYLRLNDGYFYGSYAEVFRRYMFRRKDPVPHPLGQP